MSTASWRAWVGAGDGHECAHADEINRSPKKLETIGAIPCGIHISRAQEESSAVFLEALKITHIVYTDCSRSFGPPELLVNRDLAVLMGAPAITRLDLGACPPL